MTLECAGHVEGSRVIVFQFNESDSYLLADSGNLEELAKYCYSSGKLLMDEGKAQELSKKVKSLK